MKKGSDAGLGRGFISGSLMNFRAIVNMIAPMFFAKMYIILKGKVFFVGALTVLASEGVWRSMTNEELGLNEDGNLIVQRKDKEE